jgi:aquaporin Z
VADQVTSGDAGVAGWISAELQQTVIQPIADFENPNQEWRRLFSELPGTFLLVMVAAGGGMMGAAFPNTISRTGLWSRPG